MFDHPERTIDSHEWKDVTLGGIADFINGDRGKNYPGVSDRVEQGVPFINTGHITPNGRLTDDGMDFITRERFNKLGAGKVKPDDIVYCLRGSTIGKTARNHYKEGAIASSLIIIRAKPNVCQGYLYHFLSSPQGQRLAKEHDNGSAQPNLSAKLLASYPLRIPSYERQCEIADVLDVLNNKIELNRQTNQTLEQIAQAIFKSWFVDFEPTRAKIAAKENGQNPQLAAMCAISGKPEAELDKLDAAQLEQLKATAALFPDALVESELGEIPEGWEVKPLSKTVELIGGGTPKKSEKQYWDGDIPWFSVKDAPAEGDVFVIDTELKITELGLNKSSTKLLPEGVTIISARGTVGRLALVGVPTAMNQSCYGVKGINGTGVYLNYFNLKEAVTTLRRNTHGAVFDTITRDTFDTVYLVDASPVLKALFEAKVASSFSKIKIQLFEVGNLQQIRDTLLPKLLSGELSPATPSKNVMLNPTQAIAGATP